MSVLDKFERKIRAKGVVRARKRFTLFISNGDIKDIIKIFESLEKQGLLIDGAIETVKYEIKKKQESSFLGATMGPMAAWLIVPMASSLIQPVASSLINAIAGKGQEYGFLPSLALPLMKKVLAKGVRRAGKAYNSMDKNF